MRGKPSSPEGRARALPSLYPVLGLALLLAACGAGDNDPGPGGVTVGEARALDEAAEMLDAERLPDGALPAPTPAAKAAAAETGEPVAPPADAEPAAAE